MKGVAAFPPSVYDRDRYCLRQGSRICGPFIQKLRRDGGCHAQRNRLQIFRTALGRYNDFVQLTRMVLHNVAPETSAGSGLAYADSTEIIEDADEIRTD